MLKGIREIVIDKPLLKELRLKLNFPNSTLRLLYDDELGVTYTRETPYDAILPSYQMVVDWLRQEFKIHLKIVHSNGEYLCDIEYLDSYDCGEWKNDYYKALDCGIKKVIKKLSDKEEMNKYSK